MSLFGSYPGTWWVAGGYSIEAFTGIPRAHADLDVGIPREDTPALRDHLRGVLDVWEADRGRLRPLRAGDRPSDSCRNLWLRRDGDSPWEFDVLLTSTTSERWTYEHEPRITLPFGEILWDRDGVRFLRPAVQLLYKARRLRPQDRSDFGACLPLLAPNDVRWLAAALTLAHPGHPWIAQLRARLPE